MYTTAFETVELVELLAHIQTFRHEGMRFVQLAAEKGSDDVLDLFYTFYNEVTDAAVTLVVEDVDGKDVPSIQELYFASFSYENEAHDLFGVHFINMKLDFGGHFFNVENTAPMTIISPEQKAAREKAAKLKAAAAAKAAKAAREAAEAKAAERAMTESPAEADAAAVAQVNELAPKAEAAAAIAPAAAPAVEVPAGVDERTAKMIAKLATMPPEKAAKLRENLAAKGVIVPEAPAVASEKEAE